MKLEEIYHEMLQLHKEIQERNTRLDALMAQALSAVREEQTAIVKWRDENNVERVDEPKRAPVHHVATANPANMHVLTGTLPPNIMKK
jgi:hypothetical protein